MAEELSFSRAADRLGMAQPPLSRAIRQMERRLGADLFHRDTRRVSLTELGRTMLDDARYALDAISAVSRRARRATLARPVLIATAKPGIAAGMLRRVVNAYTESPGATDVEITVGGYREQADMVRDGRADVALLSSHFDPRGLDVEPLTSEPRVAALPAGHPLARRSELFCADLRGEPIPQWPQSTPAERAYWSGQDRDARQRFGVRDDEEPSGPIVGDPSQLIEVVALGQAVALIPESVADGNPRGDVAYRPVLDASPYAISVAWPEGSRAQHIAQFVRTATDLCLARGMVS